MKQLSAIQMDQISKVVGHRPGALYAFFQVYERYVSNHRGQEEDLYLTATEAYILSYIVRLPGISASQLAEAFGKSKGFLSQVVKKLVTAGFIRRRREQGKGIIALFPTEQGIKFWTQYEQRDLQDSSHILQMLLDECSLAELRAFYKVTDIYAGLLKKIMQDSESGSGGPSDTLPPADR